MRKVYIIIINLFLSVCSIFAFSDYYMAPYGSVLFNLNSPEWSTKQNITLNGGGANGPTGEIFESGRTLIIGGIDQLEELIDLGPLGGLGNEIERYSFKLEFDGAQFDGTYFWFTKQSDPAFRRPFQIQIGYRVYREGVLGNSPQYFDLGLIEGSGDLILEAEAPGLAEIIGDIFSSGTYYVSFEFGIILPGEIKNGVLAMDGISSSMPIASGYDYSSEIDVTVTLIDSLPDWLGGKEYPPISFTIPFSGYYDPRVASEVAPETSASLFVKPNARAANIDLLNDQGKTDIPIADIDFSVFGLADEVYENDDIFMFLSSSSNPFDSSVSEFRFVHKDVGFGDAITESNSIGYKIKAVPSQETIEAAATSETSTDSVIEVTYDGTDYLTIDGSKPEATQRMYTACYKEALGTTEGLSGGRKVHWHSYSGTLYLELDTNNVIMDEGLYRSTVYVHVVTDENISKRGEVTA